MLEISINASCSLFIAVRLPDGNAITVFFIIAANFFHLLWMSYKIVQLNNMVVDETAESAKTERKRMITKLVLAESTEGMTPLALQWQIMDPMTSFLVISKMDIGDIHQYMIMDTYIDKIMYAKIIRLIIELLNVSEAHSI